MSKEQKALIPVKEKIVDFYGDKITAVLVTKGGRRIYVPVRPICDFLGVAWSSQRRRINRDPILSEEMTSVTVTVTESGQQGQMLCLPLELLNGWMFGINADRVKPEVRDRLLQYQRECYQVLAEAFSEGRLTHDPSFEALLKQDTEAVQAYQMLQALVKLARNQILIEARLDEYGNQLEAQDKRIESIEIQLGDPTRQITPQQATNISQAVKAIAMELSKRSGRNEYGGVYGELYRRFQIPSYRELPTSQYDSAMKWLRNWWQELTDDTVPF